ncbi:hypothetical protein HKX48_004322 [Thoreauomyces humboldtii]|nr:hypothetical protein HKX48_004322 [Thoreauomyces humboldtii]
MKTAAASDPPQLASAAQPSANGHGRFSSSEALAPPPPPPPLPVHSVPQPAPRSARRQSEQHQCQHHHHHHHHPQSEGSNPAGSPHHAGQPGHAHSPTEQQQGTSANGAAKKPAKPQKKALAPEELSSMIQSKIMQLENESTVEEEEEKAMARAIKKASKDMSQLIEGQSGSEKLDMIHAKYMDLFQENKRLERDYAKLKRKQEHTNKEKETAKAEHTKINAQKAKIETLCRELQKESKRVKEESKRLAIVEQHKRDELSSKFESTIWEIKSKMEEDSDEKKRRAEDSEMLKDKFKNFLEQYELREKHYNQMIKSREIEIHLLEAKLAQQHRLNEDEGSKSAAIKSQVASFVKTETDLRQQLSIYVEKFKQVEETLNKSNELFITFRKEMEQMTKKTRKLEKENATVRLKCERMNKNILEMAEERTTNHKSVEVANAGKAKMENLCRALQAERNALRVQVETLTDSSPSHSTPITSADAPATAPSNTSPDTSPPPPPTSTASIPPHTCNCTDETPDDVRLACFQTLHRSAQESGQAFPPDSPEIHEDDGGKDPPPSIPKLGAAVRSSVL